MKKLWSGQGAAERTDNITLGDQERLFGYLESTGKVILPEPQTC